MGLRTKEMPDLYRRRIEEGHLDGGCNLCGAVLIAEFENWRIIQNDFPYDRIAKTHHMIVPKRHVEEAEISEEGWQEYRELKSGYINDNYEYIFESTNHRKSIPAHFHLHLLETKDDDS